MAVVLLDIDGTLLSGGAEARVAIDAAFHAHLGIESATRGIPFAGKTDPLIVRETYARHGLPEPTAATIEAVLATYLGELTRELSRGSLEGAVLPGVHALLDTLDAMPGVDVGLLTGNIEAAARLKLATHGIDRFAFGGYGSDHEVRAAMIPVALSRLYRLRGRAVAPGPSVIVVGDTPNDVAAARAHGAVGVAVATGSYDAASLAACDPDLLLSDLDGGATALYELIVSVRDATLRAGES